MGSIKLPLGLCGKCEDGKLKPIIGKREKALCTYHWKIEHQRSEKGKQDDREYYARRKVFLAERHFCEMKVPGICTGAATEVHHTLGRGIYYLVVSTWMAACRECHEFERTNSEIAYDTGLSKKRLNNYSDGEN